MYHLQNNDGKGKRGEVMNKIEKLNTLIIQLYQKQQSALMFEHENRLKINEIIEVVNNLNEEVK